MYIARKKKNNQINFQTGLEVQELSNLSTGGPALSPNRLTLSPTGQVISPGSPSGRSNAPVAAKLCRSNHVAVKNEIVSDFVGVSNAHDSLQYIILTISYEIGSHAICFHLVL